MDDTNSPKWGSLIARHSVSCFSFAAQGEKDTPMEKMFGYIGKKADGSNRKCYVFQHDEVLKILAVMDEAVRNVPEENQDQNSTSPAQTDQQNDNKLQNDLQKNDAEFCRTHEELENYPWYHGALERSEAEAKVRYNGDFLVRHSPGKTQFVLTAKTDRFFHLLVKDQLGTDFLLTIRFNDTFSGTIYTEKGSPNCVYVNGAELRQAEYEAKIPLKGCQTHENSDGNLENEIVVQQGEKFDPRKDKRFLLTCIPAPGGGPIFRDSQVTLSFGGITIDSKQTSTLEPVEATPELDYKVVVRDGSDISAPILTRSLSVGDNVSYTVELGNGVKGRIGHCWAKDDAGSELQLSGKDGCSLQKESQVWGNFEETQNSKGGITLLNRIRAWAFPTSNEVNIFCNLHICAHCVQSSCNNRGRRHEWRNQESDPFSAQIDTSGMTN
ncbi:hypothetical protein WR25_10527 [Diploscapter pachys]|uniref:ZP domain-containing protein n=1 Tax=Diploscapter pachys TaxID=2018661 RepID=A0A2A2JYX3_9BILA|nr:hypothetical protein WR25_10527 [Diploscapter pachys]